MIVEKSHATWKKRWQCWLENQYDALIRSSKIDKKCVATDVIPLAAMIKQKWRSPNK